jgi:hypothetical protein
MRRNSARRQRAAAQDVDPARFFGSTASTNNSDANDTTCRLSCCRPPCYNRFLSALLIQPSNDTYRLTRGVFKLDNAADFIASSSRHVTTSSSQVRPCITKKNVRLNTNTHYVRQPLWWSVLHRESLFEAPCPTLPLYHRKVRADTIFEETTQSHNTLNVTLLPPKLCGCTYVNFIYLHPIRRGHFRPFITPPGKLPDLREKRGIQNLKPQKIQML